MSKSAEQGDMRINSLNTHSDFSVLASFSPHNAIIHFVIRQGFGRKRQDFALRIQGLFVQLGG